MFLAESRRPAALDVKGRVLCAGVMRAKRVADVKHSVLSVVLTKKWRPAVLRVEPRPPRAGVI